MDRFVPDSQISVMALLCVLSLVSVGLWVLAGRRLMRRRLVLPTDRRGIERFVVYMCERSHFASTRDAARAYAAQGLQNLACDATYYPSRQMLNAVESVSPYWQNCSRDPALALAHLSLLERGQRASSFEVPMSIVRGDWDGTRYPELETKAGECIKLILGGRDACAHVLLRGAGATSGDLVLAAREHDSQDLAATLLRAADTKANTKSKS